MTDLDTSPKPRRALVSVALQTREGAVWKGQLQASILLREQERMAERKPQKRLTEWQEAMRAQTDEELRGSALKITAAMICGWSRDELLRFLEQYGNLGCVVQQDRRPPPGLRQ